MAKIVIKLKTKQNTYQMVDLFTGTGAFTLAFETTKHVKTIWANDIDSNSQKIYTSNFHSPFILGDFNTIDVHDIPKCDIITAGFACQPFSIAGLQKGFEDVRSNVFWKILQCVECLKPRVVILENVKNLVGHDKGHTFETIYNNLKSIGYSVQYKVINTSELTNLPQNRERIYIVCFKEKQDNDLFTFDSILNDPNKLTFKELLDPVIPQKYYYDSHFKIWDTVKNAVIKDNVFISIVDIT
jgi:DNA (cytosine-5)-methyltransferase 1